jgi:DNA-binding NtrC family response regulator
MRILLVEDEKITRVALSSALHREKHEVVACENGREALERIHEQPFDVAITDLRLPGAGGIEVLREVKLKDPDCVVIVVTAFGTVETAVEALKLGAYDYLRKPYSPEKLINMLAKISELRDVRSENTLLKRRLARYESGTIVGDSAPMRTLLETVRVLASRDVAVLIEGESGTGKELIARALHDQSPRHAMPFVPIACGAIPETLLESELFGHEKGSFSGATSRQVGYFERADRGTAFIDDVDDLPLAMQVKLLRALQEHQFTRIGGQAPLKLDLRVVCATKVNLGDLVRAGRFREDLYYRLNIVPLHLPPLRERPGDIPRLVEHFLSKYGASDAARRRAADLLPEMTHHAWPGNVRELENVVQRIVVLPESLDFGIDGTRPRPPGLQLPGPSGGIALPLAYEEYLEAIDREIITRALAQAANNVSAGAKLLGIPRTTLRSKMEKYGISAAT